MDEVIWSVNPKYDTLASLVAYISEFASKYVEAAEIRCRFDIPFDLPVYPLTAEQRHNIFSVVKEALTNVVKHAGASEVWIRVKVADEMLWLSVEDDGKGFTREDVKEFSEGLNNMNTRMQAIAGTCEVFPRADGGTIVRIALVIKH